MPRDAALVCAAASVRAGAGTFLYVPDQSRLYLAVPYRGSQQAEIWIYDAR